MHNALLTHLGPSRGIVGEVTLSLTTFGGASNVEYKVRKQIETHFLTITDVITSIDIY